MFNSAFSPAVSCLGSRASRMVNWPMGNQSNILWSEYLEGLRTNEKLFPIYKSITWKRNDIYSLCGGALWYPELNVQLGAIGDLKGKRNETTPPEISCLE